MSTTPSPDRSYAALDDAGWVIQRGAVAPALIDAVNAQLELSREPRDAIRRQRGLLDNNDGTLHHLLGDHPAYTALAGALQQHDPMLRDYFGGNYIINTYGAVLNSRDGRAYLHNVHRDIRFSSPDKRFMLNILVMLDDFTLANGATYLLSGSQHQPAPPATDDFLARADRALGQRGDVLFFDSRLWHAAGVNTTDTVRRAITITLTSPFFKPQFDYPRRLGYDAGAAHDPYLRQIIGYNARIPATLEEYYVPLADRFYQRGQDD